MNQSEPSFPRAALAAVCAVHALFFGWASAVLPWKSPSFAGVLLAVLALAHALTAVLALTKPGLALGAWRALAFLSLGFAALASFGILSAALYLSTLYRGLGQLIAVALMVAWGFVLLVTLPVAVWGLVKTRAARRARAPRVLTAAASSLVLFVAAAVWIARSARAEPLTGDAASDFAHALELSLAPAVHSGAAATASPSLLQREPSACAAELDGAKLNLLVTYAAPAGAARSVCLQAADSATLLADLRRLIAADALPGAPIKVDLVAKAQRFSSRGTPFDALKLRPAQDGVCLGRRCFAPWQLVALDAFTTYRPIAAVQDASFGFSAPWLAHALGGPAGAGSFLRIETQSWLVDARGVHSLERFRNARQPVTRVALERGVELAERHIVRSQQPSGEFRYMLNPFTGYAEIENFTLPRQAGTTLALCRFGHGRDTDQAVRRALALLTRYERRSDAFSVLTKNEHTALLGHTALPLVALLSCRATAGADNDPLIERLARFVLSMQRDDGSFFPELDLSTRTPRGRHEALYAAGQAVLGLVLLEQARPHLRGAAIDAQRLARAIDRAMAFYSGPYWSGAQHDFFFLEENWHCLAAEAALGSHRNDAYERFCLDYVTFKARFILQSGEADPDLVGGMGLSNLFPVYNTATAGFGEALSAAIAVRRARGLPLAAEQRLMRDVVGFLLASQWTDVSCFACTREHSVIGGFSEHFASPALRIDYVQHAMAALGGGVRSL